MAIWPKSRHDQVVTGVLGGLSERWGANPTVVRLVYSVLTLFTGIVLGVLVYLLLVLIMD